MPSHIMEKNKLIEKHAAALGLAGITKWLTFNSGGAQTDALLAGGVDILNTGTGNLLLLWDRTRCGVKGIVATSAQPMTRTATPNRAPTQGARLGADRRRLFSADKELDAPVQSATPKSWRVEPQPRFEFLEVAGSGAFLHPHRRRNRRSSGGGDATRKRRT